MNRKLLIPIMIFLMLIASACGGVETPAEVQENDGPNVSQSSDDTSGEAQAQIPTQTPGPIAQRTQARSRIENQQPFAASHFDTAGIFPVALMRCARTGD